MKKSAGLMDGMKEAAEEKAEPKDNKKEEKKMKETYDLESEYLNGTTYENYIQSVYSRIINLKPKPEKIFKKDPTDPFPYARIKPTIEK